VGKPGFLWSEVKERSHLEDLNLDGREITNWSFKKSVGECVNWIDLA
jgi:hypothetical protein